MDRPLIETKIASLQACLARIEAKRPKDAATLREDPDIQDIIVLNLERSVQICVDIACHILSSQKKNIPATMAESFIALNTLNVIDRSTAEKMAKAVGFRNIAVHAYRELDLNVVFSIISKNLSDFRDFASGVVNFLEKT